MNIRECMQKMHDAVTEAERYKITASIKKEFDNLPADEKELVRKEFSKSWDEKLVETDEALKKIDVAMEIMEISKYVSLSRIAKDYFGKSREWLYQRIKGYKVNGIPAQFSPEDKRKLSMAFQDISRMAHETSQKII